jgi:hypothetical protein
MEVRPSEAAIFLVLLRSGARGAAKSRRPSWAFLESSSKAAFLFLAGI